MQFDEEALDLFVLLTGGDTRQIENELEKIDLYLGDERQVTVEQVRELVPLSRAGVIFELGNALAACDLRTRAHAGQAVARSGRNGDRHSAGRDPADHSKSAPRQRFDGAESDSASACAVHLYLRLESFARRSDRAFAAEKRWLDQRLRARDCRATGASIRAAKLIAGLEACLEANLRLVSSQLDHELVLTEIVVKLLAC